MAFIEDFGKNTIRALWNAAVAVPVRFWQPSKYKLSPLVYRAHTKFERKSYGLSDSLLDGAIHGREDAYSKAVGVYPIVDVQLKGLITRASSFTEPYEPLYSIRLGQDDVTNHFWGERGYSDVITVGSFEKLLIARDLSLEDVQRITNQWSTTQDLTKLLDSCIEKGAPDYENIHHFRKIIETHVPLNNGRIDYDMLARHKTALGSYDTSPTNPSVWTL